METLTIAVACIDSPINSSIHHLIAIHSSFKIIGEAKTGEELLELIYRAKPNIIIVDYDLPSIHSTIFNSAYKDYLPDFQLILVGKDKRMAIEAFNYSAVGYLQKPIMESSFLSLLYKIKDSYSKSRRQIHTGKGKRILIKLSNRFVYIPIEEILYIEIIARKTMVHTIKKSYETSETFLSFVDRLPWYFYRTHRSFLVNLKKIVRIELFGESYLSYFSGTDKRANISKLKIREVHSLLIQ
ncbi:LytR/AlgR family response regulator transcription factor [Niallia sp. FSL K6-0077]|uniref:LytR/AlgR family response regulator transcription factor n=1 Tax=Niallia sp. FSL K6-0077 TaxID=2954743 RepID=UPI0030F63B7A